MLLISTTEWGIDFSVHVRKFSPPDTISSPPDERAFITDAGGSGQVGSRLPDSSPRSSSRVAPDEGRDTARAGEGKSTASLSLDRSASGDSVRKSGGAVDHAERFLQPVLRMMGKEPVDLFPANKITTKCSKCGEIIPRFQGYRHIKVGDKKTYCRACQSAMGLPVREDDASELAKHRGSELATVPTDGVGEVNRVE